MVATTSRDTHSQNLDRRIEETRALRAACRDAGRDIDQEIRTLVRQMFDRDALIQTFTQYEADGYHWRDEPDLL